MHDIQYVFHFSLQKGWDFICIPELPPGTTLPGHCTPGASKEGEQTSVSTEMIGLSQAQYRQDAVVNDPRKKNLIKDRKRIMAMRNKKNSMALELKTAEERRVSNQNMMDQIEKDQKQTGVYCIIDGVKGKGNVHDCGENQGIDTVEMRSDINDWDAHATTRGEANARLSELSMEFSNLESGLRPEEFQCEMLGNRPGSSKDNPSG